MSKHCDHVWEDMGDGTERGFECDALRPIKEELNLPILDDEFRGCSIDNEIPKQV